MPSLEYYTISVECDAPGCKRRDTATALLDAPVLDIEETRDRLREEGWTIDFDPKRTLCPDHEDELEQVPAFNWHQSHYE